MVYNRLRASFDVTKVILEEPVPVKQLLKRRMKKLGALTVAGQVLFKLAVDRRLQRRSQPRRERLAVEHRLDRTPIPEDCIVRVPSANDPVTIDALQRLAPAVVVVQGTRILSSRVLGCVDAPFLNMHAGVTPKYRGVHGGYWALAMGDPEHCGVTVHVVDAGIDTGSIIGQALIHPTDEDDFSTYPLLQLAAGLPLMVAAVEAALEKRLTPRPAPRLESKLWSHPTLFGYLRTRLRAGVR